MAKTIKSRIQSKHDFDFNWQRATGFIPLEGEIIIYDQEVDAQGNYITRPDPYGTTTGLVPVHQLAGRAEPYTSPRIKIGNGTNTVEDLEFITANIASADLELLYSDETPVMDGTAAAGAATTVARSDHKHPTDTSRAAQADLVALRSSVENLISCGTADPSASTASQFYLKYTT